MQGYRLTDAEDTVDTGNMSSLRGNAMSEGLGTVRRHRDGWKAR
jgi:hypothetical protein